MSVEQNTEYYPKSLVIKLNDIEGKILNEKIKWVLDRKLKEEVFAVTWLDDDLWIRKLTGITDIDSFVKKVEQKEAFIQRMRIFNSIGELHIWRSSNSLLGRLRIDEEGDEIDYIESRQLLLGTKIVKYNGGYLLKEDKGELHLPELENVDDDMVLVTRNYITYTKATHASINDSRFVGFDSYLEQEV